MGAGVKSIAFFGCPATWGCWDGSIRRKVGDSERFVGDTSSPFTGDPCQQDLWSRRLPWVCKSTRSGIKTWLSSCFQQAQSSCSPLTIHWPWSFCSALPRITSPQGRTWGPASAFHSLFLTRAKVRLHLAPKSFRMKYDDESSQWRSELLQGDAKWGKSKLLHCLVELWLSTYANWENIQASASC